MRISFSFIITALLASTLALTACQDDDTTATPSSAVISGLSCSSATFSTTAVSGAAYSGTAAIPYTGGNGSSYDAGSAISSTGVTGRPPHCKRARSPAEKGA